MDNNEIIRRYEKLVSTIEKSDIYDGRWTYDLYKCESCGKEMVTTYADKGVTPLIMESKLIDMMHPAIDGLGTLYLCAGLNTG